MLRTSASSVLRLVKNMPWFVYIIFCDQKIYYVGSTNDVQRRLLEHQNGLSNYTHKFSDIKLVYKEELATKEKALAREIQIKGWSLAKKKALINGRIELLKNEGENVVSLSNHSLSFRTWRIDEADRKLFDRIEIEMLRKIVLSKWFVVLELGMVMGVILSKEIYIYENYWLRIGLYVGIVVMVGLVIWWGKRDKKKLGLGPTSIKMVGRQAFWPMVILGVGFTGLRLLWPELFVVEIGPEKLMGFMIRALAYVVVSVPMQELVFRGYGITRLEQFWSNKRFLILGSSLIFGVVHWPFGSWEFVLGSFILGVYLAINFIRYRNLYTTMLIHAQIGLMINAYIIRVG